MSSSSESDVKEEDAWIQLLINYHKSVLSSWDFAIDVGANWLKAQAHMWSPEYLEGYIDRLASHNTVRVRVFL